VASKEIMSIINHSRPYIALALILVFLSFFVFRFFSPRMEQVRRDTFEESKAYNEGMAQELRRMQLEYMRATPEQQEALASVILHQMAGYDSSKLPHDMQCFLNDLKKQQGVK
jgi:hypothetical protein